MMVDPVRWFDALGKCRCGKAATGVLRGPRNDSYGPYCQRCADARLKKARKEQDAERAAALADVRARDAACSKWATDKDR